jgi:hypothetical protein
MKYMLVPICPNCPLVNGGCPFKNSHLKINQMYTFFVDEWASQQKFPFVEITH